MDNQNNDKKYQEVTASKFIYSLGIGLPTFDWIKLKKVRKQEFINYKKSVNDANELNGIKPENDNILYKNWLLKEIVNANEWKLNINKSSSKSLFESDLIQIDHYISFLEQESDNLSKIVSKKQKTKISYIWQNNPDKELPELHSLMIEKYKLIASETKYEHFKAVFTGQPIDEIEKIKKTKKFTNVLLTYFISKLFQKSNPNDYLNIAESCFDAAKNLSQAQTNYFNNQNRLPKNHSLIDALLKDLPNPL